MTSARIFKPGKTAMQSGKAKTQYWILEYEPESSRQIEPLMGYTSSSDMKSQVRLKFNSKEDAIAYAKRNHLPYTVQEPHETHTRAVSYADNFKYGRKDNWTH